MFTTLIDRLFVESQVEFALRAHSQVARWTLCVVDAAIATQDGLPPEATFRELFAEMLKARGRIEQGGNPHVRYFSPHRNGEPYGPQLRVAATMRATSSSPQAPESELRQYTVDSVKLSFDPDGREQATLTGQEIEEGMRAIFAQQALPDDLVRKVMALLD